MTDNTPQQHDDDADVRDTPLDPWMLEMVRDAVDDADAQVEVPRDMMWARIQRARRETSTLTPSVSAPVTRPKPWRLGRQLTAAAAVLVAGVAIGRYVLPAAPAATVAVSDSTTAARDAAAAVNSEPVRVAMQEHLARTVSLLTTVRDDAPTASVSAELGPLAKELLTTTRLLLDQPQLRDDRTRRLLQDLELVLLQVIQARTAAPETQNAPRETLRETNLLTRVNALVTASAATDAAIYGDD